MTSQPLTRAIILIILALILFSLVYAFRAHSLTGIILSLTSLGAAIHFLNLLARARKELEHEQEEAL